MTRVLAIYREERFSPNAVERDKAILDAAADIIRSMGLTVDTVKEQHLACGMEADAYLTMARSDAAIGILAQKERTGAVVMNRPAAVRACARDRVDALMRADGLPAAPLQGAGGYWIKRADEAAQCADDVCYVADETEKDKALQRFAGRGISRLVVTAHVRGDLVKFYGVRGTGFFRFFYPTDDGMWKFDDERINGRAHHFRFSEDSLQKDAERLACLTGTDIYGGDCIVRADGSYAIIDFNDFPSFSRCRRDAAEAIAALVVKVLDGRHGDGIRGCRDLKK